MAESRARRGAATMTDVIPTDALKEAGQQLVGLLVQRAAQTASERVGDISERLDEVTENGGKGLGRAFGRNSNNNDNDNDNGAGGGLGSAVSSGFGSLKEKIKNAFGGGGSGGGGKKLKVTNIVESIDVGLPLRTTYNLWTQFADFPGFMKKVESVEQSSDTKTNWKAQVFLSHRTWEATIAEQVPDSHLVWRAKGPKGHVDGAVSFTELGPNLTRVLLVLEYWPQGLFERTGNLWRAQGRRARLEFKHFRRYAMTTALLHQDDIEGWRGEVHDNEVVKTHEQALEEERDGADRQDRPDEQAASDQLDDSNGDEEGARDHSQDEDLDEEDLDAEDVDAGDLDDEEEVDEEDPDERAPDGDYRDDEPVDEYEEEDDEYDEPERDERASRPARTGGRR